MISGRSWVLSSVGESSRLSLVVGVSLEVFPFRISFSRSLVVGVSFSRSLVVGVSFRSLVVGVSF